MTQIYVGTYKKYNNGNLFGEWINLDDYDYYDDLMDYLTELHKDEDDPEFMVQDYEDFPEQWYSETCVCDEDWFDKVKRYLELSEDEKGAFEAFLDNYGKIYDVDDFRDRYVGEWDSKEDFAEYIFSECYPGHNIPEYYINYKAFARDIFYDGYTYLDGYVFQD